MARTTPGCPKCTVARNIDPNCRNDSVLRIEIRSPIQMRLSNLQKVVPLSRSIWAPDETANKTRCSQEVNEPHASMDRQHSLRGGRHQSKELHHHHHRRRRKAGEAAAAAAATATAVQVAATLVRKKRRDEKCLRWNPRRRNRLVFSFSSRRTLRVNVN